MVKLQQATEPLATLDRAAVVVIDGSLVNKLISQKHRTQRGPVWRMQPTTANRSWHCLARRAAPPYGKHPTPQSWPPPSKSTPTPSTRRSRPDSPSLSRTYARRIRYSQRLNACGRVIDSAVNGMDFRQSWQCTHRVPVVQPPGCPRLAG